MAAAPPFDAAAKAYACRIAAAAGKPKTRDEGLKAIHAALHRTCFSCESDAWKHFGVSRQRFSEWKQAAVDPPAHVTAPTPPSIDSEAAAAAARQRKTLLQRERRHGEEQMLMSVVESMIVRLEQEAAQEQRAKDLRQRARECSS